MGTGQRQLHGGLVQQRPRFPEGDVTGAAANGSVEFVTLTLWCRRCLPSGEQDCHHWPRARPFGGRFHPGTDDGRVLVYDPSRLSRLQRPHAARSARVPFSFHHHVGDPSRHRLNVRPTPKALARNVAVAEQGEVR